MITDLSHINRAASHAVATALAPKNSTVSSKLAKTPSVAQRATATAARSNAAPAATGTAATGTAAASNSTITSNDFLTLLVSELKNQDPTQPTDPNAYISQLVGVNSLEQLIQINSGITSLQPKPTPTPTPTSPATGS